jgi:succinyl-diaminopimelate desuccinylase
MSADVVDIAKNLISCPSVTPVDAGAQEYLAGFLKSLDFECHHLKFEDVPNLFARIGTGKPHLCYAGHTDVVPPGAEKDWKHGPFNPVVENGKLYGRGASDMKGSVAAFAAAAMEFLKSNKDFKGSISFLITGDEEGPAINGTVKVLEWMVKNGHIPEVCLVGEPTNPAHHGQEVKIGRRGSLSGTITVTGKQGHAAYPHMADNPVPRIARLVAALSGHKFDNGTEFFQPTNLEVTTIDVGNPATNVIPQKATAKFNIRFNNTWTQESIQKEIRNVMDKTGEKYQIEFRGDSSHSFLTQPGEWTELVKKAVMEVTGRTPKYTTSGGTSDARFAHAYCPVVEYGGVNESIHAVDENTDISVLQDLVKIYKRVLELYFS